MTETASHALAVRQLHKRFGTVNAVRDVSFTVGRAEVLGLLGPNGAGKSTVMQCVAGLLAPDGGAVDVGGDGLFYLPDGLAPWPDQPAGRVLEFAAELYGTPADAYDAWRAGVAPALGIEELRGRRVGELSKGQRKRVLVALALLVPRGLVLMDEPFDGLDLRQTREAIALLRREARGGRSLVLSIHSMRDAERACDRLVLLSDGRSVAEGTPDELRARAGLPQGDMEDVFLALT